MKFSGFFSLCFLLISTLSFAQHVDHRTCSSVEVHEAYIDENPGMEERFEQVEREINEYIRNNSRQGGVITIPVVVHVIHEGENIGTGTNLSEDQVRSQIEVLNEDFRRLNADAVNTPAAFQSVAGDAGIEFCLATIDPNGNPTDGIDRYDGGGNWTNFDNTIKPATTWDASRYLNIWSADIAGGTLGYATFPGTQANRDGVVIGYRYFGRYPENPFVSNFNLGRTCTHEVGHYLGLQHIWGDGGCSVDDGIGDTPLAGDANYGCQPNTQSCGSTDMVQNYMDYTDDDCMNLFTQGQIDRMQAVLGTSRAGLTQSPSCVNAAFFSYGGQIIDQETGVGVPNAKVLFYTEVYQIPATTDANGWFTIDNFTAGDYSIYAGKWGYMTNEFKVNEPIDSNSSNFIIPIRDGVYYDDFIMDFEWNISGNAATGNWVIGDPIGTVFDGSPSNPGDDIDGDFGKQCYITGNAGGGGGTDDVDDGITTLSSPTMDLTDYDEPYLSYYRWFYNDGGNGAPLDDDLRIEIDNGITIEVLELVDMAKDNTNFWEFSNFRLKDVIDITSNMKLTVEIGDQEASGHIVEGAIDLFSVVDSNAAAPTGIEVLGGTQNRDIVIATAPNPANNLVKIAVQGIAPKDLVSAGIFDLRGKLHLDVTEHLSANTIANLDVSSLSNGIYLIRVNTEIGYRSAKVTIAR